MSLWLQKLKTMKLATKAWLNQLGIGEWWPAAPKGIATESGSALDKKLKQEHYYRQVLLQVAKGVENALEDGYIEREIQLLYERCHAGSEHETRRRLRPDDEGCQDRAHGRRP